MWFGHNMHFSVNFPKSPEILTAPPLWVRWRGLSGIRKVPVSHAVHSGRTRSWLQAGWLPLLLSAKSLPGIQATEPLIVSPLGYVSWAKRFWSHPFGKFIGKAAIVSYCKGKWHLTLCLLAAAQGGIVHASVGDQSHRPQTVWAEAGCWPVHHRPLGSFSLWSLCRKGGYSATAER